MEQFLEDRSYYFTLSDDARLLRQVAEMRGEQKSLSELVHMDRVTGNLARHIESNALLHAAAPAARLELVETAEAHEEVDEPLHLWPGSEDHTYHVPVLAHETTEADEAPVEGADENENTGNLSEGRTITAGHRYMGEKV